MCIFYTREINPIPSFSLYLTWYESYGLKFILAKPIVPRETELDLKFTS